MAGEHGSLYPTNHFRKLIEELNMGIIIYAILRALKGLSETYVAQTDCTSIPSFQWWCIHLFECGHTVMWLSFYTRHLFFLLFQGFFSSHKSTDISVRMIQRQQCRTSRRCSQIVEAVQVQSQEQALRKHSAQSSIEGSNPLTRQWPLRSYRLTKWCNCEVVSLTPRSASFSLLQLTKLNFSTARNSIKSRLLHLPAEIRNRIFALALGGYHIHVFNNSLIRDSFGSEAFGHTTEIITESTKKREETPLNQRSPKPRTTSI